jgi:hypothetical protein
LLLEGHLYYFTPFYFKNGGFPENKFFIVLKNIDNKSILASLPTKKNNAPSLIDKKHGCINLDERKFNCYLFSPDKRICENGFKFKLPTHVYGNQMEDYEINRITKEETIKIGIDYELKGKLNEEEFNDLLRCLENSKSISSKFKRMLSLKK